MTRKFTWVTDDNAPFNCIRTLITLTGFVTNAPHILLTPAIGVMVRLLCQSLNRLFAVCNILTKASVIWAYYDDILTCYNSNPLDSQKGNGGEIQKPIRKQKAMCNDVYIYVFDMQNQSGNMCIASWWCR